MIGTRGRDHWTGLICCIHNDSRAHEATLFRLQVENVKKEVVAPSEVLVINRPLTRRSSPKAFHSQKILTSLKSPVFQDMTCFVAQYDPSRRMELLAPHSVPSQENWIFSNTAVEHLQSNNCRSLTWLVASWRLIMALIVTQFTVSSPEVRVQGCRLYLKGIRFTQWHEPRHLCSKTVEGKDG